MALLSTLGGIALLGINGFVVGPLIAVLFVAFWQIFGRDFNTGIQVNHTNGSETKLRTGNRVEDENQKRQQWMQATTLAFFC